MTPDSFRVELVGHAALRVQSGGRTLLTDPWLVGPVACRSEFHFPPLVHDLPALVAETDAIYVSHVHPDHFHPPSLALFPTTTPIYIGAYRRKTFRDALHGLGFPVVEVPFEEPTPIAGTDLTITVVEHDEIDSAAFDSAAVIAAPDFTVFENNDCFLTPETYARVRARFAIDYAFLGYSPASFFPIAFELPAEEKARLLAAAAEQRYAAFVDAARHLEAGLSIPFASGARFLHPDALWKNVVFNSAVEAVRRLAPTGLRGDVMDPGDGIDAGGIVHRRAPALERDDELTAIAAYAARERSRVLAASRAPVACRADILTQLRDAILLRWRDAAPRLPGLRRYVIAFTVRDATDQECWFDFSQPPDAMFHVGSPPRYDMRYTYPADALQECLDGVVSWDELLFATGVAVHQVRYAREFHLLMRSEVLALAPV